MLLFDVGLGWVTSDYISRGLGWVTENGPTAMSATAYLMNSKSTKVSYMNNMMSYKYK